MTYGVSAAPRKSVARIAALILLFALGVRFALSGFGTVVLIAIRFAGGPETRFNPTALRVSMLMACGVAVFFAILSVLHFLGGARLMAGTRGWRNYLIGLAFVDIVAALTLNQLTIYVVTSGISRILDLSYVAFQRIVTAELAFVAAPGGCVGMACFPLLGLAIPTALVITLFLLPRD